MGVFAMTRWSVSSVPPNQEGEETEIQSIEAWRTSAAFGWLLVEEDPTNSNIWLRLAPVLLLADDREGYQKLCEHVLAQETILSDAGEASRAAKVCLLMPEAADVSKIDAVLIRQAIDNGERDDRWRIWTWSSLALLAYREGDAAAALNHLESASAEGEASDNQQALREQWSEAAEAFAKAVADTPDTEEYYEYAACLVLAGRDADYRQVVTDLAELAERSGDPSDHYAAARAAILVPQSPVDPDQSVQSARQAAEADSRAWRKHVLGLALFRAGKLDEAAELLEQVRNGFDWGQDLEDVGLCLVELERGRLDAARGYRSMAGAWITKTAESRAEGKGRGQCTNWLELQVLLREADARLNP